MKKSEISMAGDFASAYLQLDTQWPVHKKTRGPAKYRCYYCDNLYTRRGVRRGSKFCCDACEAAYQTRQCKNCGQILPARPIKRFCNRHCYNQHQRKQGQPWSQQVGASRNIVEELVYIYILKEQALSENDSICLKVGHTRNLERRMRSYATHNPRRVLLLASCMGHESLETDLQYRLRSWRVRGEWFWATAESVAIVHEFIGEITEETNEY